MIPGKFAAFSRREQAPRPTLRPENMQKDHNVSVGDGSPVPKSRFHNGTIMGLETRPLRYSPQSLCKGRNANVGQGLAPATQEMLRLHGGFRRIRNPYAGVQCTPLHSQKKAYSENVGAIIDRPAGNVAFTWWFSANSQHFHGRSKPPPYIEDWQSLQCTCLCTPAIILPKRRPLYNQSRDFLFCRPHNGGTAQYKGGTWIVKARTSRFYGVSSGDAGAGGVDSPQPFSAPADF